MPYSKTLKPLVIYLVAILILAVGLNLFLQNYSMANYSTAGKEELLSAPSRFKMNTGNPCTHSIYGDPDGEKDYIKINLHCNKDESSTNTMALKGISPDNFIGALYLLSNINVFEAGVIPERVDKLGDLISEGNDWRCFTGINSEIKNFSEQLKSPTTINCFYKFTDEEIKEYYEAH